MKKNNLDVPKIINEINEYLTNGTKMIYIESLNLNENYKEKEIRKAIKEIKKQKIKNFFKKLFIG